MSVLYLLSLCVDMIKLDVEVFFELTIHSFSLDAVVTVILGEEELEISLGVLHVSDLILLVDEVSKRRSVVCLKVN